MILYAGNVPAAAVHFTGNITDFIFSSFRLLPGVRNTVLSVNHAAQFLTFLKKKIHTATGSLTIFFSGDIILSPVMTAGVAMKKPEAAFAPTAALKQMCHGYTVHPAGRSFSKYL